MSLTNKTLWIIERNLNKDLTLGGIAEAAGVSRYHLAHAFGSATGRSVMEYARGFLTAYNLSRPEGAKQIQLDNEAIELSLRKYCEAHPTEMFINALDAFARTQLGLVRVTK